MTPRDAEVFVDGYYAGTVDDFDGVFQALKLDSGGYKIEIRKPGFETLHFDVRVQPESNDYVSRRDEGDSLTGFSTKVLNEGSRRGFSTGFDEGSQQRSTIPSSEEPLSGTIVEPSSRTVVRPSREPS